MEMYEAYIARDNVKALIREANQLHLAIAAPYGLTPAVIQEVRTHIDMIRKIVTAIDTNWREVERVLPKAHPIARGYW